MASNKDKRTGYWRWRKRIKLNGRSVRKCGAGRFKTKRECEENERSEIDKLLNPSKYPTTVVSPKFSDFFNGQFWTEWVVAQGNKPSETDSKKSIFKNHLEKPFGHLRIDQIGPSEINQLKAHLLKELALEKKTINNILGVLSKP